MSAKKQTLIRSIFFLLIFCFLYIFYVICHPMVLNTPDDWRYINYWREFAFTIYGRGWNPGKVLPEISEPLAGQLGVYILMPFVKDFLKSVSAGLALIFILYILFFVYSFNVLIRKRFNIDLYRELFITLVFFLFHFWIFKSAPENNYYMFFCSSPNLYFNYAVPYLFNFSVCFLWASVWDNKSIKDMPVIKKGLMILIIYLAIFSNLFQSAVIATFAGLRILIAIYRRCIKKDEFRFFSSVSYEITVLILWIYCMFSELSGGNARLVESHSNGNSFFANLATTFTTSLSWIPRINKWFMLFVFIIITAAIFSLRKHIKESSEFIYTVLFAFSAMIILYVFQLMVCAYVGSNYILRVSVAATYFECGLVIVAFALIQLTDRYGSVMAYAPICTLIIISMLNTSSHVYEGSVSAFSSNNERNAYYVEKITEADSNGESFVLLPRPDSDEEYDDLYKTYIPSTLYKFGITSKLMEIGFE